MYKKTVILSFIFLYTLQAGAPLNKPFNEIRMVMTHNSTSLRPGKSLLGKILRGIIESFHPSEEIRIKALNAIQRITLIKPNPVADQEQNIDQQLKDGIRAFKLPISKCGNEFRVCHTVSKNKAIKLYNEASEQLQKFVPIKMLRALLLIPLAKFKDNPCLIDTTNVALVPLLKKFNTWLDAHPQEVFTFLLDFSQFSSAAKIANRENIKNILSDVGFLQKMYVHTPEKQWPTIKEMAQHNKRIVIIANTSTLKSIGILHKKSVGFGSTYNFKNLQELAKDSQSPKIDWGTASANNLFLIDNYTTPHISGNILDAKVANSYYILKHRIKNYEKLANHTANFVMVDFYNEPNGDIFKVIDDLNNGK